MSFGHSLRLVRGVLLVSVLIASTGATSAWAQNVNWLQVTGAGAGNTPGIVATGGDSNIGLTLIPKGAGTVGIGTASPNASAALDLSANTNSMLLPVGTTGQAPTCNTALQGATRYNTTNARPEYCNGSAWSPFRVGCSGSATGPDTSLASGLIAYWSFDENSGIAVDDLTGNNNTGTWQGTLGSQWTSGKINTAGNFDGTDNYISTVTSFIESNPFTVSAWFKTTTASGHKIVGVENSQTGTGSSGYDHHLYVGTNGQLYFGVCGSAGCPATVNSSATVTDGNWHHAVGTETGSVMTLYLDGASQGSKSNTPNGTFTVWWRIGGWRTGAWPNASDGYFTGSIDEVGIWNVALSAAQVSTLYNSGAGDAFGATVCPAVITSSGGFTN